MYVSCNVTEKIKISKWQREAVNLRRIDNTMAKEKIENHYE
jgi:cell fate (sporulation/competence/biofilm development) regulator YmcA (YheA/YmcA/DUF963 family)